MRLALNRPVRAGLACAVLLLAGCEAKRTGPDPQGTAAAPEIAKPSPIAVTNPELAKRDLGFDASDADRDGQISSAEYAGSASRLFTSMDADDNGGLTVPEMEAARAAMQIGDAAISSERMVAEADNDGDGKLTLAEFIASVNRRFTQADMDKDGYITRAEFSGGHPELPARARPEAAPAGGPSAKP